MALSTPPLPPPAGSTFVLRVACCVVWFFLLLLLLSQNTFVPGVIQLAEQHKVYIGGDDFKSGQTKMKSVMVDFLVRKPDKGGVRLACWCW